MTAIETLREDEVLYDVNGNSYVVQEALGTYAALVRCENVSKKIYREQLEHMMTQMEWDEYLRKKKREACQARLRWEKEVSQEISRRGIRRLVHFTKLENLTGILRYGLLSSQELRSRRLSVNENDTRRLDMHPECSCLSVTFPNYRLFYYFRQLDDTVDWIVLELTPDVLFSLREYPIFCPSNAASEAVRCKIGEHQASDVKSFQNMFAEESEYRGSLMRRKNLGLSPSDTTDPQAEILFPGSIPLKYINKIKVNDMRVQDECQKMVLKHGIEDISVAVDQQMFSPRRDYPYWRTEYYG